MLKKSASGVLWLCRSGSHRQGVALSFDSAQGQDWTNPSERIGFFEHSLSLMLVVRPGALVGSWHVNIQQAHTLYLVWIAGQKGLSLNERDDLLFCPKLLVNFYRRSGDEVFG